MSELAATFDGILKLETRLIESDNFLRNPLIALFRLHESADVFALPKNMIHEFNII